MGLLKKLAGSRKAMFALAGVVVAVLGEVGIELAAETVQNILWMLGSFVVGQGIADAGAAGGSQGGG